MFKQDIHYLMKIRNSLLIVLLISILALGASAQIDQSKMKLKVGDVKQYYLVQYTKNGITKQDLALYEDQTVLTQQGYRVDVEVAQIKDNGEMVYNVSSNYEWTWGFTPGNLSEYGDWNIFTDWSYWLDADIGFKDQFMDRIGNYEYQIVETKEIGTYTFDYYLKFKIPMIKFRLEVYLNYRLTDGSLEYFQYEQKELFQDSLAQYTKDYIVLRRSGALLTERPPVEQAPLNITPILASLVISTIVIRKRAKPSLK